MGLYVYPSIRLHLVAPNYGTGTFLTPFPLLFWGAAVQFWPRPPPCWGYQTHTHTHTGYSSIERVTMSSYRSATYTTQNKQNIHALNKIRIRDSSSQAAAVLRLSPHDHRARPFIPLPFTSINQQLIFTNYPCSSTLCHKALSRSGRLTRAVLLHFMKSFVRLEV